MPITPDILGRTSIRSSVPFTASSDPVGVPVPSDKQGNTAPPAYSKVGTPYYIGTTTPNINVTNSITLDGGVLTVDAGELLLDGVPVGGGGGGAVASVSGTSGQIVAAPTTGAVVLSLPNVGTAGATTNPASVTVDAKGRVSAITSLGYTPTSSAQVDSAIAAAVAGYAPLAGATFTGAVNTVGTTLSVAPPVASSNAATKAYVDAAISGVGAVTAVSAGSNIAITGTATVPIVNLGISANVPFNNNSITGLNNLDAASVDCPVIYGVDTIDFGGVGAMTAVGALTVAAGGAVNMTSIGNTSIFATGVGGLSGEVIIGGPINHITIGTDGKSITGVADLTASGTLTGNAAVITGTVGAADVIATNNVGGLNVTATNDLTGEHIVSNNEIDAGTYVAAPILRLVGNEAPTPQLASMQIGTDHIIGLQNSVAPQVPAAGMLDTAFNPVEIAYDDVRKYITVSAKKADGTAVLMSEANLSPALADYVPLAGTAPGAPMTGTLVVDDATNIEAKNITTALLSALPSVGYISALAPMQVEGGNFLVANGTSTEIGLAATASPPIDQVATIKYNYATDDLLHFNKALEAPGAVLDGNDVVPLLTFKDARTFYVSKQGADTNSGAINAPFLTIQAAVSAGLATGAEAVVDIAPGVYSENITIASVAGIVLRGSLQNDRCTEGTSIQGQITVNVSGTDNLFNNQVVISGCLIGGQILDTSSKQHTLIVDGCRIEADSALGGEAITVNMTATDGRTRITNCVITQEAGTTGINPLVSVNVGQLNMNQCELTVRAEGCCITVSGSAILTSLNLCSLTSTSASATPNALLFLNSTTATPHNIGLSTFNYAVATSKTAPGILATRPSAGLITAVVAQCYFALAGTLAAGNVIQYGAGTALVLLVAENRSLNTAAAAYASRIQSGATVLPLTQVGETTVNTVNSLSGALTLAAGTNVSLGTVGNTITINSTASGGTVNSVVAGTGIAVDSTTPSAPVVSNTGVLSVAAGAGIAVSSSTGAVTISATGSASGATLYFNKSVASDIPTYYSMSTALLSNPETTLTASTSGSTPVLVGAFATPVGYPNTTQIDAGIWNFNAYASVDSAGSESYIYGEIYKRSAAGTETLLGTSDNSVDINSITPTPVLLTFNEAFAAQTVLTTDRLVVKFYYVHTGGSATTLTMYFEGTSHYSYVQTTINAIVVSGVQSVTAGTGISLTGTASDPIVNNDGVLSVGVGTGLVNTGTAADPVIAISGTGTITTQDVNAVRVQASGTGTDYSTFGVYPRVGGTYSPPTDPLQLAPVQYVDDSAGVQSLTAADGSITVGGTAADPTVAVSASGVVAGAYTNTALTVGSDGRITAATSGAAPVLSVSAGGGISVDNSIPTAPIVSNTGLLSATAGTGISIAGSGAGNLDIANTGVLGLTAADSSITVAGTSANPTVALPAQTLTPAAYAWPALTVDSKGVITAISENDVPFTELNAGTGIGISGSPGTATISNTGVISVAAGNGSITVGGTAADPTVAVATSGVTAGAYTNASLTVGADGRLTAASSGSAPVTSVSGTIGQTTSTGGTTPAIGLATVGVAAGAYTNTSLTVDTFGRVTAATSGTAPVTAVSAVVGQTTSTGGTTPAIGLADTAVVAGSYTNATLTVDGKGRLTAASSGTAPVTSVSGTSGEIASSGGTTPALSLVATGVTPAAYTYTSLTVDVHGRITTAASGTAPVVSINGESGAVTLGAGTNITLDETVPGTITINAAGGGSGTVTSVSGTAGQIGVATGTTTPVISLATAGTGAATYAYPASVQVDAFGRVVAATAGTNPAGTYLPLAGGTMSGAINMGAQAITNAGTITAATTNTTALSLPNAGAGGTAFITALQTDTAATPTNNLFITQTSGALSVFKPLANPVIQYLAGAAAGLYTYLVPQFYGERHVFSGTNVAPTLFYNTSNNYTVGANSVPLSPFYVELTNASANTITVQVRYPGALAVYPPVSTAPSTTPPVGTWTAQSITIVGGTSTTTPTMTSGTTRRLFFNGTAWFLQ